MRRTVVLLVLSLLFILPSIAQTGNVRVKGSVLDSDTKEPLIGAMVLVGDTDKGDITNNNGEFSIVFSSGEEVVLHFSYVGYSAVEYNLKVQSKSYDLSKPILMKEDGIRINDVTVRGKAPIGLIKGDTTQYNAGAFKTNPDASSQDLISKMPGMEISESGGVTAQGEDIEVVYVDGQSYFKNDVGTALTSLPASIVESVQVYDDRSSQGKFLNYDDGNNKKAINIVTKKKPKKTDFLGDVMVGYGTDNRYMGSANFNMFGDKDRITFGVAGNNLNVSPNRQRRYYGMAGQSGITDALGVNFNYIRQLKEGEFAFSYIMDNNEKDIQRLVTKDYLSSDEVLNQIDSSINISWSHRFGLDYEQTLNDRNRVEAELDVTLSNSDNYNMLSQEMIGGTVNNNSLTNSETNSVSYSVKGELDYIHKFNDKRNISLGLNGSFSDNDGTVVQTGYTDNDILAGGVENINQETIEALRGNTISGDVRYTERLSKTSRMMFMYNSSYDWADTSRKLYVYDEAEGQYIDLQDELSSEYNRDYFVNSGGLSYILNDKAHKLTVMARYESALLDSEVLYPQSLTLNRSYSGANINSSYRYSKNKEESFSVWLRSSPSYPSVDNLQEVMDISNPLSVSSGNSQLKPSQRSSFRFSYNKSNIEKSTVFRTMISVQNTTNMVANNTTILDKDVIINGVALKEGTEYTTLANLNGYWSVFSGAWFSMPLSKIKTNLNMGLMYSYRRTPSVFNGENYITETHSPRLVFRFSSNITENIDFNIYNMLSYSYSNVTNGGLNRSIIESAGASINYIFWKGFFVNVDYKFIYNHYIDNPIANPIQNQLNASFGKKFFNDQFELRVSAFDILDQNKAVYQSINDISVNNTISNNLERYFSVSLRYKFNTMKDGGKKNSSSSNKRRHGRSSFSM